MKRFYQILVCLIFTIIIMNTLSSGIYSKAEETKLDYDEKVLFHSSETIIMHNYEGRVSVIEINEVIKVLLGEETIISTKGNYIDSLILSESEIYLITKEDGKYKLFLIDPNQKGTKNIVLTYIPHKLSLFKDGIIVVGENNNDACLYRYDRMLNLYSYYIYECTGNQSFNDVIVVKDMIYVLGTKDATLGDLFSKVGSYGESKTFLSVIDEYGKLVNSYYFNLLSKEEIPAYFRQTPKGLIIGVTNKVSVNYYLYDYINISCLYNKPYVEDKTYLISDNLSFIEVGIKDSNLMLESNKLTYFLYPTYTYLKTNLDNGYLKVVLQIGTSIKELTYFEYHIDYNKTINIQKENSDFNILEEFNHSSYISVASLFTDASVKIQKVDPFFNKQISGEYQVTYNVVFNNGQTCNVDSELIIETYTNVFDGGIYNDELLLSFTGYATLDGNSVLNGHIVNSEGEHKLELRNNLGNTEVYTFYIVKDYKGPTFIDFDSNLQIMKGNNIVIDLTSYLEKMENVESSMVVFVDDKEYQVTKDEENKFILTLPAYTNYGLKSINFQKLIINEIEYQINQNIKVNVLKQAPSIEIFEEYDSILNLKMDVSDYDNSIVNVSFKIFDGTRLIEEYNIYEGSREIKLENINPLKLYTIKGYLNYQLGDNQIRSYEYFSYEGTINKKSIKLLSVEVQYNNGTVNLINTKMYTDTTRLKHQSMIVDNVDLSSKYQQTFNYKRIIIAGCLTLVIASAGVLIVYLKRRKKKLMN
ncbi:MAG: hypothetical protein IJD76_03320 [Bacilli bacterium]|nr:hypothetical protein [Bacilli bacterium]